MSQLQSAQILHISASAEGMYEQGRRVPSLETLTAMAAIFHVSLDYLITAADVAALVRITQTPRRARKKQKIF